MLIYVCFFYPDEWQGVIHEMTRIALRLEEASGGRWCLPVPFYRLNADFVRKVQPEAIILSGFGRSFQDFEVRDFYPVADVVETFTDLPILAFCGGHQLLGFLFNGALRTADRLYDEPMRLRRPGEPIINYDYHPEYFMERGFYELTVHEPDPLFEGCGSSPVVFEAHYCEVKKLPPGFKLLASTPECRIQAMRHLYRPLVSLQFHPEQYTDGFPDGKRILENFFREVLLAR
jgi:GMP synthase (glutamine-hydrolysing)